MVNKHCLCQTDFSCHNGKGSVLSYSNVIRLEDKNARNQWSSADKLASIRDVFRSIISRFPMEYAPNDHITAEEQFSGVDRQMSILHIYKITTGKLWDQSMGCCWRKEFSCSQNAIVYWQDCWAREKKPGLRVLKDMVCYLHGTGKGVTADNFFTSCEQANRLLTWILTLVGKLK